MLNDNQKAATFIGWKPNARCAQSLPTAAKNVDTTGKIDRWMSGCGYCGWFVDHPSKGYEPHDIPAPDMTDPKNWVRALEELRNKYPRIGPTYNRSIGMNDWECSIGDVRRINFNLALAVIAALAALYDAEHKS